MQSPSSRVSPTTRRNHTSHQPPISRNKFKTYQQNMKSQEDQFLVEKQCSIKLNTSHLGDRPIKGNNIVIRKSKNTFPIGMKTAYSHFRNQSNPCPIRPQVFQSIQFSNRRTQKERYIQELQSKVLNSEQPYQLRSKTTEEHRIRQISSHRYNPIGKDLTSRGKISPNKSYQSVILDDDRPKQRCINGLLQIKSLQQADEINSPFRSRSRTIAKEFILQGMEEMLSRDEISKTIQIEPQEIKEKLGQSLNEIQRLDKRSFSPETPEMGLQSNRGNHSQVTIVERRPTQMDDASDINHSVFIKNSEVYQEEIDMLTNQFFGEWAKMSLNKSQIYQSLRNKLIKYYPNMRKHYTHYNIPKEDGRKAQSPIKTDNQETYLFSNQLNSQMKMSQNLRSSNQSLTNALSATQIKEYQQKLQFFNQKRMLREIFKQAYFYSRTRNKFMSTNYITTEEKEEEVELRNIQKNLTFMVYIKDKCGKSVLNRRRKIRGTNIIRNKESILELQPEGTKGQQFLKKCLDDAIEDCIRANQ